MLKASVILPSYNRAEALRLTLGALAEQSVGAGAFEVIVVDDGSTDGSADLPAAYAPALLLRVLQQGNRGAGAARNLGARHARGELLIFLDADMVPTPALVEAYAAAFALQPNAVFIGRILARTEAFQTLFDRVTRAEMSHDLGPGPRQLVFYNLASGNFAIGASTFGRLCGFDEALRMTEDMDLGYRADRAGVPFCYCPGAVGHHNHPKTLDQRCAYVERGAYWTVYLLAKHPQMAPLLPIYQDILPPQPSKDSVRLAARKLGRRALANPIVYGAVRQAIALLERYHPEPRLLRPLYYKALSARRSSGFRQGCVESGWHIRRRSVAALDMVER